MARLRSAGFSNISAKYLTRKCTGKIYSHPKKGLLQTDMTKAEIERKFGKGWKRKNAKEIPRTVVPIKR